MIRGSHGEEIPETFIGKPEGYPADLPPAEVKKRFLRLLGPFEKPEVPLNLRVTDETPLPGGVVRQRVVYDVARGESVPAYHMFLKGLPREAPGVLAIHGHGGEASMTAGKNHQTEPKPDDPVQHAYRAALAGYRVLAPDALLFGERRRLWGYSQFFWDEIIVQAELTGRGLSLAWKSVWDNSRAIEALEFLGARAIGAMGLSGGSTQTYILTAANPKVRAGVCFQSFATLRHQFYQYKLAHCLYHYIPGMVAAGIDWDQVVATAAPRRLFLGRGGKDEGSPAVMCEAFVAAIERRCREEGLPPSVETFVEPDQGHTITEPMLASALRFLSESLSPEK